MASELTKYTAPEGCGPATKALVTAANEMLDELDMSPGEAAYAVTHHLVKIVGQLEGQVMTMRSSSAVTGTLETSLRTYTRSLEDRIAALEQRS
ncbi:hypothetical protein [Mycobacterium sp. AT1]|uniref:hypothetical protein n=1 Tax=Mycobacterium sp. AT1 TaxID=1961706 RepID=UPI00114D5117|nr:hypothetical protein [Mycobacterium sp. AT1]